MIKIFFWVFLFLNLNSAFSANSVKVGLMFSRTGGLAGMGTEGKHGFELAIEQLAEKWKTKNYSVSFVMEDSKSEPGLAATAVMKLIKSDQVHIVIGDLLSTTTIAAASIAQTAQVPLLTPAATSDKVTQIGDYIFRACYLDSFQGIAMAHYAIETLKVKTAALLVDLDVDHSRDVSKIFGEEFEKLGGTLLKRVSFSGNHDSSFVPQLTELRSLNADVIYSPVYYPRMGIIFRQAKTFQIHSQFLGTDAWDSPLLFKLARGATAGALMTDPFSYRNPAKNVQSFRDAFKKKYGVEPSSCAALAYDSIFILDHVLESISWPVKEEDLAKTIRDHLAQVKAVRGVTGQINLDPERNGSKKEVVILRLTEDGYEYQATWLLK